MRTAKSVPKKTKSIVNVRLLFYFCYLSLLLAEFYMHWWFLVNLVPFRILSFSCSFQSSIILLVSFIFLLVFLSDDCVLFEIRYIFRFGRFSDYIDLLWLWFRSQFMHPFGAPLKIYSARTEYNSHAIFHSLQCMELARKNACVNIYHESHCVKRKCKLGEFDELRGELSQQSRIRSITSESELCVADGFNLVN